METISSEFPAPSKSFSRPQNRVTTSWRMMTFVLRKRKLRLLPTFAGALRQKHCTRASLNKTPTNYISLESLINVLDEKNTILAKFSFRKCQKPVRRETTEGSSIEFIGYRIPKYEQNGCTVLFTRHQSTKVCRAFSIF